MSNQETSSSDELSKSLESQDQQITVLGITLGIVLGVLAEENEEAAKKIHKNLDIVTTQLKALITDKRARELQDLLLKTVIPKDVK